MKSFDRRTVDELAIGDERSLRHVAMYADLKEILRRSKYSFRVLPAASAGRMDRALFLNLTFWTADDGGDVLLNRRLEADVVAHVAWHHLAARMLGRTAGGIARRPSIEALFLGESIASAFDVYLVGRLLGHAPRSTFLATQVPAMAEATEAAGLSAQGFTSMLEGIAEDPEGAFADLRALLTDATAALMGCKSSEQAQQVLVALDAHRFGALLHRYELSNWILYARAYGSHRTDARARAVDRALRQAKAPLEWLAEHWIAPALAKTVPASSGRRLARKRSPV